ncbi:MAG: amino acid adenylation domain-containing protein [Gammaproteobacteria bacterium]|nr:amino acid adenylation domain-containing protein [Gammaproteobacteria bacterium]
MTARFLHQHFAAQARVRPDALALSGHGGELTYGELDRRARALAGRLRREGIGAKDLVALCLDWPPDFFTAMLGVLYAGAAWLPIETSQPAVRIRGLLSATQPKLVLTNSFLAETCATGVTLVWTVDGMVDTEIPVTDLASVAANQLCYVVFTSGSTGQPKPVMVSHGNVAGLFDYFQSRYGIGPSDAWSQFHSCAFGFSIWEIWGAFRHGGRLVTVPPKARTDPTALRRFLETEAVTILSQTPAAFRQLLLDRAFDSLDGLALRLITLSGEALPAPDLRRWFAAHGDRGPVLIDTYALTETGGQVSCREYRDADAETSLGDPLPGVELRVLDENHQPAIVGELFIGGPGVALGYLGDAETTARKFVRLDEGRARFYRTGDRVERLRDGQLRFLGRTDSQFKWRGYRIEPGEIETALRNCPGVSDAAVALHGAGDHARLVAYYVPADDHEPGWTDDATEFWPSIGPYQVYDEFLYDLMSTDTARLAGYRRALQQLSPGKIVLDIGAGEHAVLARYAAEAGARHVYAVEVLPEAAARARRLVEKLGLADRITVLAGDVADLELPNPAEVITQGIIGNIGSADGIVPIWNAARRLIADNGTPVPARCDTLIAPVELPDRLRQQPAFGPMARHYVDKVFAQAGRRFDIRLCVRNLPASSLLAPPAVFESLDFRMPLVADAAGGHEFQATRAGQLDGFLLWTVVQTDGETTLDNFASNRAWLPVFMPLPDESIDITARASIGLRWARMTGAGICPDYRLEGKVDEQAFVCLSRYQEDQLNGTRIHRALWSSAGRESSGRGSQGLQDWLAARLPGYMLPTSWQRLAGLPLNANGKLDRGALPEPSRERPALGTPYRPPRPGIEQRIASVWTDVLDLDDVGADDNFFELGGDSIAAVRLVSELQRAVQHDLSLAAVFDAPTVAGVARLCQTIAAPAYDEGEL